jgi:branched-subunit amino acid ABC-type transport system permease component
MLLNWKQTLLAILSVFVTPAVVGGAIYSLAVERFVTEPAFFRAEGEEHMVLYLMSRIILSSVFVYLFARFSNAPKLSRGIQFGLVIWLLYSIPMVAGFWAFAKLPDTMALGWLLVGLGEFISGGVIASMVLQRTGLSAQRAERQISG